MSELNRRVGNHDLVVTSPAAYLLVVDYGNATVRHRTHIVGGPVPWYWGTAVFGPQAVLHDYPTAKSLGTIYYVDVPGQPTALPPPEGSRRIARRRCFSTICLTVYASSF
jgi:hypothetical protein